jgi:hypothetical protein
LQFKIISRNEAQVTNSSGGDIIRVVVKYNGNANRVTHINFVGEREKATVTDKGNGTYIVEYIAKQPVFHGMTVTLNGTPLALPYENIHLNDGNP